MWRSESPEVSSGFRLRSESPAKRAHGNEREINELPVADSRDIEAVNISYLHQQLSEALKELVRSGLPITLALLPRTGHNVEKAVGSQDAGPNSLPSPSLECMRGLVKCDATLSYLHLRMKTKWPKMPIMGIQEIVVDDALDTLLCRRNLRSPILECIPSADSPKHTRDSSTQFFAVDDGLNLTREGPRTKTLEEQRWTAFVRNSLILRSEKFSHDILINFCTRRENQVFISLLSLYILMPAQQTTQSLERRQRSTAKVTDTDQTPTSTPTRSGRNWDKSVGRSRSPDKRRGRNREASRGRRRDVSRGRSLGKDGGNHRTKRAPSPFTLSSKASLGAFRSGGSTESVEPVAERQMLMAPAERHRLGTQHRGRFQSQTTETDTYMAMSAAPRGARLPENAPKKFEDLREHREQSREPYGNKGLAYDDVRTPSTASSMLRASPSPTRAYLRQERRPLVVKVPAEPQIRQTSWVTDFARSLSSDRLLCCVGEEDTLNEFGNENENLDAKYSVAGSGGMPLPGLDGGVFRRAGSPSPRLMQAYDLPNYVDASLTIGNLALSPRGERGASWRYAAEPARASSQPSSQETQTLVDRGMLPASNDSEIYGNAGAITRLVTSERTESTSTASSPIYLTADAVGRGAKSDALKEEHTRVLPGDAAPREKSALVQEQINEGKQAVKKTNSPPSVSPSANGENLEESRDAVAPQPPTKLQSATKSFFPTKVQSPSQSVTTYSVADERGTKPIYTRLRNGPIGEEDASALSEDRFTHNFRRTDLSETSWGANITDHENTMTLLYAPRLESSDARRDRLLFARDHSERKGPLAVTPEHDRFHASNKTNPAETLSPKPETPPKPATPKQPEDVAALDFRQRLGSSIAAGPQPKVTASAELHALQSKGTAALPAAVSKNVSTPVPPARTPPAGVSSSLLDKMTMGGTNSAVGALGNFDDNFSISASRVAPANNTTTGPGLQETGGLGVGRGRAWEAHPDLTTTSALRANNAWQKNYKHSSLSPIEKLRHAGGLPTPYRLATEASQTSSRATLMDNWQQS